jgi:hypothetical protein
VHGGGPARIQDLEAQIEEAARAGDGDLGDADAASRLERRRGDQGRRLAVCGSYVTVSVAVAWWTIAPLVPFRVSVKVPRAVLSFVFTVIVERPGAVTEGGLKLTLACEGRSLTDRPTAPENPPCDETVIVYVVALPCLTFLDAGLIERAKSKGAFTTSVTWVDRTRPPPLPLIVSG